MPLTSTITHTRMLAELSTVFLTSTCAIYEPALSNPSTYGEAGAPALLSGHDAIPCTIQRSTVKSIERRLDTSNPSVANYTVILDAVYSSITTAMSCVIGGVTYNIVAVHHASAGTHTQLEVERVRP